MHDINIIQLSISLAYLTICIKAIEIFWSRKFIPRSPFSMHFIIDSILDSIFVQKRLQLEFKECSGIRQYNIKQFEFKETMFRCL